MSFIIRMALVSGAVSAVGASPAFAAGDPVRGRQRFKATCEVCHLANRDATRNDERTKIGPNLYGVVGRAAGTHKGFRYSQAMRTSGVRWDAPTLRRYTIAPQKMIPNVRMSFAGLSNTKDVDDIIAYLATLK